MKQIRQILLLLTLLLVSATAMLAQRTITGKVTDGSNQEPLVGASVTIKGTTKGVLTDVSGSYRLDLPNDAKVLVVSFVGFTSKEVTIGDASQIDVVLGTDLNLNDLIVIGSRNAPRTKLETAVAVDVIPVASVINEIGQVDLNQILTYIAPSFQSARQAISDGTDHVDPAQMRGLGPDQVLVLVNGKRRHQSSLVNVNGTVNRGTVGTDLNAIPATAIDRIEILRDGAAAQYGSDAIAGVINIVLKKTPGLNASVSYGTNVTSYNKNYAYNLLNPTTQLPSSVGMTDGGTMQAGLSYGFRIGEKGYLNLMAEVTRRQASNRTGTYTGRLYTNVSDQNRDDSIMKAGGLNRNSYDMLIGNSEVNGAGAMFNLAVPLNEHIEVYAFGGYNNKKGNSAGFYRFATGANVGAISTATTSNTVLGLSLTSTNSPIPENSQAMKFYPDGFLPVIKSDVTDISFAAGLRGSIGTINYDLSHTYGKNSFDFITDNSVNYTQSFSQGAAAQRTFNAGGTGFSQNTTNLDLSHKFREIANGLNVAVGAEYRTDTYTLTAGEESSWKSYLNANGAPTGVASGAQVFAGFTPSNAGTNSRSNVAGYADVELDVTKQFLIGGALRFENYSDFGSTFNYKAVARYIVADGIALRASASTGFRAPSQQQKYFARTSTLFVNNLPTESGTFTNSSAPAQFIGIPTLKQETSQHFAVGATAKLAEGLELSIDAYQITINDRIVLTNNFAATAFTGADTLIRNQLRSANAETANFFTNAVNTRARGIEGVLTYATKFDKHSLRFSLAASVIDNKVLDSTDVVGNGVNKPYVYASPKLIDNKLVPAYFNREDESRFEVAVPAQKVALSINYKYGKFGILLRNTYFGQVIYLDPTVNTTNAADTANTASSGGIIATGWPKNDFTGARESLDQTFGAKIVTDLSFTYELAKGFNVTLGANNLFDVYQDQHTHSGNMSFGRFLYSRRVQQQGFNGRYVFARLVFNLK
jgi:iron complex outermembrane recepter protein